MSRVAESADLVAEHLLACGWPGEESPTSASWPVCPARSGIARFDGEPVRAALSSSTTVSPRLQPAETLAKKVATAEGAQPAPDVSDLSWAPALLAGPL